MRTLIALTAVAALGLAACSPAEQEEAETNAEEVMDDVGAAADEAGEAVEGAVNDAATEVEHATDDNPATD